MEKINNIQTHLTSLSRIITVIAIIVFLLPCCRRTSEEDKTLSGTIYADVTGKVTFMYSRTQNSLPASCLFTTDLLAPNDRFEVTVGSGQSSGKKDIEGLSPGQKVSWTATVKGKPLNHGSGNFVHIIND